MRPFPHAPVSPCEKNLLSEIPLRREKCLAWSALRFLFANITQKCGNTIMFPHFLPFAQSIYRVCITSRAPFSVGDDTFSLTLPALRVLRSMHCA